MDDKLFNDLLASVREGGAILRERRERAICRAAAEITGLTAGAALALAEYLEGKHEDASALALFVADNKLRRYAELAGEA
jgi:hypothetical protein